MFNSRPPTEGFPWDDLRKILPGCQQMANVPNGVQTLPKIWIAWTGCTNVKDRQTDRRTDGRWHIANVNVSSRSLKMRPPDIGNRTALLLTTQLECSVCLLVPVFFLNACCWLTWLCVVWACQLQLNKLLTFRSLPYSYYLIMSLCDIFIHVGIEYNSLSLTICDTWI